VIGNGDAVGTDGKSVREQIEGENGFGFEDNRTGFSGKILELRRWKN